MSTTKDLTLEAPSSPRVRVGGYALLARMADKGRASLIGKTGEYHFNCPLDNYLFGFKEVKGEDVLEILKAGGSNEDVLAWLNTHGAPKTPEEIATWSNTVEGARPYDDPEKKEWFAGECAKLGLDPAENTLFDWLEVDDRASFSK